MLAYLKLGTPLIPIQLCGQKGNYKWLPMLPRAPGTQMENLQFAVQLIDIKYKFRQLHRFQMLERGYTSSLIS